MSEYTVSRLARLAGVSVRTLHHYDRIGLLEPRGRTKGGYRVYGPLEVERLQQILFYRELDMPLADIRIILDSPGFDPTRALRDYRKTLRERMKRLRRQEVTLTGTLKELAAKEKIMDDSERFDGLGEFDHREYRDEAMAKFGTGPVEASEERVKAWSDRQKAANFRVGEEIARDLAALRDGGDADPAGADARELARRQHEFVNLFWDCGPEAFKGLGSMYVEDGRFAAYYERFAPGLAVFFRDAIHAYVDGLDDA